jgi:hypothetical protein
MGYLILCLSGSWVVLAIFLDLIVRAAESLYWVWFVVSGRLGGDWLFVTVGDPVATLVSITKD